ncbi:MAG: hypothetical protein Alpg2KO_08710 [Alphaproteobacteria bacterium]
MDKDNGQSGLSKINPRKGLLILACILMVSLVIAAGVAFLPNHVVPKQTLACWKDGLQRKDDDFRKTIQWNGRDLPRSFYEVVARYSCLSELYISIDRTRISITNDDEFPIIASGYTPPSIKWPWRGSMAPILLHIGDFTPAQTQRIIDQVPQGYQTASLRLETRYTNTPKMLANFTRLGSLSFDQWDGSGFPNLGGLAKNPGYIRVKALRPIPVPDSLKQMQQLLAVTVEVPSVPPAALKALQLPNAATEAPKLAGFSPDWCAHTDWNLGGAGNVPAFRGTYAEQICEPINKRATPAPTP